MKRWTLLAAVIPLLFLAHLPGPLHAQTKDALVVGLVAHAPTLDPHMHFERIGVLVNINMFDSLLHRNTKLEFEPSLATSWKALSETQWEFKIRKGVRFHNGEIMTAEDVKYSFDRVLDPKKKSPQYGNIRAIKEVRVVDPETVHIITDKPFPLEEEREGLVGDDVDSLRIDHAHFLDGPDVAVLGRFLLGVEDAVEGVLDVLRRHDLAVVEADALADLEFPLRLRQRLPRRGEGRLELELGVPVEQRVEHVDVDE